MLTATMLSLVLISAAPGDAPALPTDAAILPTEVSLTTAGNESLASDNSAAIQSFADQSSAPTSVQQPAVPARHVRTGTELRAAVSEIALRSWRLEGRLETLASELMVLHEELQADTQLPRADRERLTMMVRNRLLKVGDALVMQLNRQRKIAKKPKTPVEDTSAFPVALTRSLQSDQPQAVSSSSPPPAPSQHPDKYRDQRGNGPGERLLGAAGGGVEESAEEFIEMIQRVIEPDAWKINGGKADIVFFRHNLSLVVSAPSDVHHQVGGLLRAFRR